MKKLTLISILVLTFFACSKEKQNNPTQLPPPNPPSSITNPSNYADYWGCWKEINSTQAVYDIILTEETTIPHGINWGNFCFPLFPVKNSGVFRNDSLVFNDLSYEYAVFVSNDTLTYNTYAPQTAEITFIKQP